MANNSGRRSVVWAIVALLSSVGTLLCCALPAVLVMVGMGAPSASPCVSDTSTHQPRDFNHGDWDIHNWRFFFF